MNARQRAEKIATFLKTILDQDQVVEIRALDAHNRAWKKPRMMSGFWDTNSLPELARTVTEDILEAKAIYFTPNPINPLLLHRCAYQLKDIQKGEGAADSNIIGRNWLLIDCDSERGDSHISATNDEHHDALERCAEIKLFLAERGFPRPIEGDSGNGGHLMYRVDLPNDEESKKLLVKVLAALDDRFSDERVKVDQTVFNAARVWKLPFTFACKGSNTKERPHRMASILRCPKRLDLVPRELLEELAGEAPEEPAPPEPKKPYQGGSTFDIHALVMEKDPQARINSNGGGTLYELSYCPWCPDHKPFIAFVRVAPSGSISAGCQGNRCQGKKWADLRELWAPKKDPQEAPKPQRTRKPKAPQPPLKPPGEQREPWEYHRTDLGNAELLWDTYGSRIRFVPEWKTWMIYDGRIWREDKSGAHVGDLALKIARTRLEKAPEGAEGEAERDWAIACESSARTSAMLQQLARFPHAELHPGAFDADPWILNVANGALDLKTGVFRAHDRADFCTRMSPVSYDTNATCPTWRNYLQVCQLEDAEKIAYLQRWAGYGLTGSVEEHKLAIFEGFGRNGKSTFLDTMVDLLGLTQGLEGIPGYAHRATFETFLVGKQTSASDASPDLAALKGARLVLASEASDKRELDEAKLKDLTGGEVVTARDLFKGLVSFRPTHKILLSTNEKPKVRGTDEGIWSRLHVIQWKKYISVEERDLKLGEKLKKELPGILNWCLAGLKAWLKVGLKAPQSVLDANAEYRRDEDVVQRFMDACCVVRPGVKCTPRAMYKVWQAWAVDRQEHKWESAKWLEARLTRKGLRQEKDSFGELHWHGIDLTVPEPTGAPQKGQTATGRDSDDDDDTPKPPKVFHRPQEPLQGTLGDSGTLPVSWSPGTVQDAFQGSPGPSRGQPLGGQPRPLVPSGAAPPGGPPGALRTPWGREQIPDYDF